MAGRLTGKTAVVMGAGAIGAGWGNGKATAVAFAREGVRVICADLDENSASETVDIIEGEGGVAIAVQCDATSSSGIAATISRCVTEWGALDILHNNVGTEIMGSVVDISEADWDRAFAINLKSAMLGMKHAIPLMVAGGGGAIINISSMTALRHVGAQYASYYASKAALCHLTRVTAIDYADKNIRVNAILPGMLRTPHVEHNADLVRAWTGTAQAPTEETISEMWRRRDARIPLGKMGDGWDVAHAAVFLASDEAKHITGIDLVIDGGMSLRVP